MDTKSYYDIDEIRCSLCGKMVKEGYCPDCHTDEECKILEANLKGEPEEWFVCENCVQGYCQEPGMWIRLLNNGTLKDMIEGKI